MDTCFLKTQSLAPHTFPAFVPLRAPSALCMHSRTLRRNFLQPSNFVVLKRKLCLRHIDDRIHIHFHDSPTETQNHSAHSYCESGCAYHGITDFVTNTLMKVQHVTVSENSVHNYCVPRTVIWTWRFVLSRQT